VGAISVPYYALGGLDRIPNDGTWVVAYCACPHHASGEVVTELRKHGYPHTAVAGPRYRQSTRDAILDDNDRLLDERLRRLARALPPLARTRVVAANVIGSVAEGRARDGSDVDLVLVLDHGSPERGDYSWWDREVAPRLASDGGRFPVQPLFVARTALDTREPHSRARCAAVSGSGIQRDCSVTNPNLVLDYIQRAGKRLKAVELLLQEEASTDVVRESQEVVELALKGVLRSFGLAVPCPHDVSEALEANAARIPRDAASSVPAGARSRSGSGAIGSCPSTAART